MIREREREGLLTSEDIIQRERISVNLSGYCDERERSFNLLGYCTEREDLLTCEDIVQSEKIC